MGKHLYKPTDQVNQFPTDIQSFLNKSRKDKFVFFYNVPQGLKNLDVKRAVGENVVDIDSIAFTLTKVKVPSLVVKAIAQPYSTDNFHYSSHKKEPFAPLRIDFHLDNRYSNYMAVYNWINWLHDEYDAVPDADGRIAEADFSKYQTDIGVLALNEFNEPVLQWTFTKAFPVELSDIDFDYSSGDDIPIYANFAFSQMHLQYLGKE